VRDQLATHQAVTVILPASDGRTLKIRKGSLPEPEHKPIAPDRPPVPEGIRQDAHPVEPPAR
jgi:hypothetical protein